MTEPTPPVQPLVMVGDPDAAVCVDDSCLLPFPGAGLAAAADRELEDGEAAQVEPGPVG